MNKYEQKTDQVRKSTLRSSLLFGMAGLALVVLALAALGATNAAPSGFWSKVGVTVAVILLLLRQLQRQLRRKAIAGKRSRAAQPDPLSQLHLND